MECIGYWVVAAGPSESLVLCVTWVIDMANHTELFWRTAALRPLPCMVFLTGVMHTAWMLAPTYEKWGTFQAVVTTPGSMKPQLSLTLAMLLLRAHEGRSKTSQRDLFRKQPF